MTSPAHSTILVSLLEASDIMMLIKALIANPQEAKELITRYRLLKAQRADNKQAFAKLLVTMGSFDTEVKAIKHLNSLSTPQFEKLIDTVSKTTRTVLHQIIDIYLAGSQLSHDQKNELKILRNSLTGDPLNDSTILKKIDKLLPGTDRV